MLEILNKDSQKFSPSLAPSDLPGDNFLIAPSNPGVDFGRCFGSVASPQELSIVFRLLDKNNSGKVTYGRQPPPPTPENTLP